MLQIVENMKEENHVLKGEIEGLKDDRNKFKVQ